MGVLPPLVARRVERLKRLNRERERLMERYMEEIAVLEMKYSDLCKPLCKDKRNVIVRLWDGKIESIRKDGGGKNEEGGSN